jgi:hypothetical protein
MKYTEIINEARLGDFPYMDEPDKTTVSLKSHQSQIYTNLAKKVKRINELKTELKALEDEVKQSSRENVSDLFDIEDAVKTRVIDTVSFIITLSKDPKATVSPKYKDILEVLEKQLTPELISVLEGLKKTMVTVTQKAPSLKIEPKDKPQLDEGKLSQYITKLKNWVMSWGAKYDAKLDQLKSMAGMK